MRMRMGLCLSRERWVAVEIKDSASARCADGFISFDKRQRNEPKKNAFPDRANRGRWARRDFPTRHPCLGRKTPPIHGRRPPGLRTTWSAMAKVKCTSFLPLLLIAPLTFRAVKRAEHRRAAGPKSGPCLSAASLGRVPRRPRSAGDRRGIAAPDRVRRKRFWFLLPRQKELAQSAKPLLHWRMKLRN